MAWWKRLLGRSGPSADPGPAAGDARLARIVVERLGHLLVEVRSLDLVGRHAASPNGRYQLIWQDRRASADGSEQPGRYLLLDDGMIAARGVMARPHDGEVADNGSFILNDWGSSQALEGGFYAFSASGACLVERRYAANILNGGLSPDGRFAACQTCHAPKSADDSLLSLFDLTTGDLVGAWQPESGPAKGYRFPGGGIVELLRGELPSLRYAFTGEFLDRGLWLQDGVARGQLHMIRQLLREGTPAHVSPDDLRRGCAVAIAGDERFVAEAWRLLGELEDQLHDPAAALAAYDQALRIDPRIGVAKRAAALRRQLPAAS